MIKVSLFALNMLFLLALAGCDSSMTPHKNDAFNRLSLSNAEGYCFEYPAQAPDHTSVILGTVWPEKFSEAWAQWCIDLSISAMDRYESSIDNGDSFEVAFFEAYLVFPIREAFFDESAKVSEESAAIMMFRLHSVK
jgi:hypothetical protein